jgi:hypothetical protein
VRLARVTTVRGVVLQRGKIWVRVSPTLELTQMADVVIDIAALARSGEGVGGMPE